MKTTVITVTSRGTGMREAMEATEKLGVESGLERKEQLHLRLLSEELIGLLRGIAGETEASYWVEQEEKAFALHLASDVTLNQEMRRELLAVSTSGENLAAQGFMGKLREMIAVALLPKNAGPSVLSSLSLGFMSAGSPTGSQAGLDSYLWSLNHYKEASEREDVDELEKSIVASIADEVSVSVVGSHVEITISKAF